MSALGVADARTRLDADLAASVRRTSLVRQVFYVVVLLVALTGQVWGAHEALALPLLFAIPAVAALELGGIVVLSNADTRRRLGERAVVSRALSAAIAVGAVSFNWLAHDDKLLAGFFAGMSALGYLVWLMHTENQRRDRLRAIGALPPTTPAYELAGHWLRHPLLTLRAKSLAKISPELGLYGSLDAARAQQRQEQRTKAIAKVLHRKIRAAVDPTTADIATATYDLDAIADRLAAQPDYDGLTDLIARDLHPARLLHTDEDLVGQLEAAQATAAAAVADAKAATARADDGAAQLREEQDRRTQVEAELQAVMERAEAEALRRADAADRAETLATLMQQQHEARDAAEAETARLSELVEQLQSDLTAAQACYATAETAVAVAEAKTAVTKPAGKRQPSAAERIAKAVARSPKATDATIAARLDLSEATVKRHRRRQAVDSVSTPDGQQATGSVPLLHAA
ncbi:hypothetical protein ACFO1B_30910 [Dactylosporangium siamense]|uniref:Uncharacterized protein n=1 Tax=Dactylosporangium siamense TaxID=685454 RepID=A0A919PPZ8_9ACTN|nr:hypothetical protein [Dactylosporangium siamense]GIG48112.1 hypothetical protein Dsi01nite_061530 [Dactylosporangium siamense]